MDRRHFTRQTAGGSIASLLALTGKSQATALDKLAASPGINPTGAGDFLVLEPDSATFRSLTQGFNGRWLALNARQIYLPLLLLSQAHHPISSLFGGGIRSPPSSTITATSE